MKEHEPFCRDCPDTVCINRIFNNDRIKFHPKEIRHEVIKQSIIECPNRSNNRENPQTPKK